MPEKSTKSAINRGFDQAIKEAMDGVEAGHGGPFGAAIIRNGRVIARAHNTVIRDSDPTAHAEVNAIRAAAARLKRPHLKDCTLVATSEPCPLCLAAAYWAGIKAIHFALPRQVAAKVGFQDSDLYDELVKDPRQRGVPTRRHPGQAKRAEAPLRVWLEAEGKTY